MHITSFTTTTCVALALSLKKLILNNGTSEGLKVTGSASISKNLTVAGITSSGKVTITSADGLETTKLKATDVVTLTKTLGVTGKITGNGGTTAGQNAGQMKLMMYGMPLMFFFLFYDAPSGLLLYWTVSNLIQLAQQLYINKKIKNRL